MKAKFNSGLGRLLMATYLLIAIALPASLFFVKGTDALHSALLMLIMFTAIFLLMEMAKLESENEALKKAATQFNSLIDGVYYERNVLVSLLARLFPSGLRKTNIPGWSPEWDNCVYIDLPTGQISYHFHDNDRPLFAGLPAYEKPWDQHDKGLVHLRLMGSKARFSLLPIKWVRDWIVNHRQATINRTELSSDEEHAILVTADTIGADLTKFEQERRAAYQLSEPDWNKISESLEETFGNPLNGLPNYEPVPTS